MQRFEDQAILVTGAGGGIGQASALRLAQEGGAVYCVDLSADAVEATVAAVVAAGGKASGGVCDISDENAVKACVTACVNEYGGLNALVNMAGVLRFDDTEQLTLAQWQSVINVNLTGTMLLCREALPHLVASKGAIVNAASTAALAGLPCGVAYSASKGGVLAMTRSIAIEYAKRGVRANCICPGEIKTGMTDGVAFPETMDFDLISRVVSPTGARGPEVVASVIAMLASQDGVHITGEDIRVDGGTLA